jgi:phospholipase/carboxylesterase
MAIEPRPLQSVFIPAAAARSRQLWVMLHGLGDSVEGFRWMPGTFQLPGVNYLLVNAPDEYYGGYSWYDYEGDMQPGVARSRRLLFQLLDAQRAAGFPAEQTILGGFSQGCLMSLDVAARYPHRLAGVVGISGYVCQPETLVKELSPVAREQKFLITHGTCDPLLPIEQVRPQVQQLQQAGLQIAWQEFAKEHTIAGQAEVDVIRKFVQTCLGSGK